MIRTGTFRPYNSPTGVRSEAAVFAAELLTPVPAFGVRRFFLVVLEFLS